MCQMRSKGPWPLGGRLFEEIRCANCRQDHPAYVRSCDFYKKEKEILEVKHKRNMFFLEAKKIIGSYMGENGYSSVAQRMNTTNQDNKYRSLVEKLIQLEANDWPRFQEHLKKLHSAEFYQTPAQQQVGNGERSKCYSPNKNTRRIYHSNTN